MSEADRFSMSKKQYALVAAEDLIADFLYYDRKEDQRLGREDMERLIKSGELTEAEVVDAFAKALRAAFRESYGIRG